jgi:O-antigen ligase
MKIQDTFVPTSASDVERKPMDWLAISAVILAILLSSVIAFTVEKIGIIALLAIPAMFVFVGIIGKPEWGLIGFLIITCTQFSDVAIRYHNLPSVAQPLAVLMFGVILIRIAVFGEQPLGWIRAGTFLLVYASAWLISLLHAGDLDVATQAFISFLKDSLGMLIVVYFIQSPAVLRRAIWALIVAGLLMGTISTFQYITSSYGNLFWGFGGWEQQISGAVSRYRITGPYANPNAYAQVLVVLAALALDRVWHERQFWLRLIAGYTLIVGVLTVFFTYSRGGFLSLVFMLSVLLIQRRFNFIPLLITALIGIGLIQFLPNTYSSRINSLVELVPSQNNSQYSDPSFLGRLSENKAAYGMFQDDPLLGAGIGNFKTNYQKYSRVFGLDNRRDPRAPASLYLEILSEQGLVGAIVFVALMIYIFAGLLRARRNFLFARLEDDAFIANAVLAGVAGYMFEAIFKNSAYSNVFWLIVGVALATIQVAQTSVDALLNEKAELTLR